MHPTSKERFDWIRTRLYVLDLMVKELSQHRARYVPNAASAEQMPAVMANILQEEIQLSVEVNVLAELMRKEAERRAALEADAAHLGVDRFSVR